uniref:Uncharacterized protein n=1 Tax=Oryza glumipatula TaxID=40148 RepID=A0A0D9YL76_9ORYZ
METGKAIELVLKRLDEVRERMDGVEKLLRILICREEKRAKGWEEEEDEVDKMQMVAAASSSSRRRRKAIKRNRKRKEEDASEKKKKKQQQQTEEAEAEKKKKKKKRQTEEAEVEKKIEARKAKQEAYERYLANFFDFEPFPRTPDHILNEMPEEERAGENRLAAFADSITERHKLLYQRCIKDYMDKDDHE